MLRKLVNPTIFIPIALVVAALIYVGISRSLGPRIEAVPVKQEDLTQTVVATGRVITPARVELGAVAVGTVTKVLFREGEKVAAGAVLAQLKDDEQRAAVAQARATLAEADARIAQIGKLSAPVSDQSLKQAEANFIWARDELDRTRRLAERGFFSLAKVEEAERNLAIARAARDSALAQAATNQPKGSDFQLAVARRAQAQAALDVAQARLDNTVVRTPLAGTVLRRTVEPGDVVQAGKTLFELAVAGETQLVMQVDEKNLALLRLGQEALGVADAYPGQRFPARISYIAPGVDAQRGTVEVKLVAPHPPAFLRPDMTVSVEVEAGRAQGATVVPTELIREASSSAPWVMVARDGEAVRQPVKLGLRGAGRTQVFDGVAVGELIIAPTASIESGGRVRAVEIAGGPKRALKAQEIIR
jgi:HlyD family secretion protein